MKRIEHLIKAARRNTENEQEGITDGIDQHDFVRYAHEANQLVRSKLIQAHSHKFIENVTMNAEPNQEFYETPENSFLNYNIVNIFFSINARPENMFLLQKRTSSERIPIRGYPTQWYPAKGGFYANPIPQVQAGIFHINRVERQRQLSQRAATVSSNTYDAGTRVLSALTLAEHTPNGDMSTQRFDEDDYLTIIDASGNVKMQGIQYSAIDTGTGVVTLEGGNYTAPEGSTIANGDYVVKGEFASSHSQLDFEAEPAVLAYMEYLVFKRDSSADSQEAYATFQEFLNDLIDNFSKDLQENYEVPIISSEYF